MDVHFKIYFTLLALTFAFIGFCGSIASITPMEEHRSGRSYRFMLVGVTLCGIAMLGTFIHHIWSL